MLLLYRHREAQRSPQRRVKIMKTLAMLENELAVARDSMIKAMDRDAPYVVVQGHKANVSQIRAEIAEAKKENA